MTPRWLRSARTRTAPPTPVGPFQPRPGELAGWLGLLGLFIFVVCYSYERAFYETFGLTPEDIGHTYPVILGRAASGAALVASLSTPAFVPFAVRRLCGQRYWRRRPWSARAVSFVSAGAYAALLLHVLVGTGAAVSSVVAGVMAAGSTWTAEPSAHGDDLLARLHSAGDTRQWLARVAPVVLIALVFLAAVVNEAGSDDARRLVRTPRATQTGSMWQMLLGMSTPAAAVTWTPPSGDRPQRAAARILGTPGDFMVVFDLDACTLRWLPASSASAAFIVAGSGIGASPLRGSSLPRCPR